ncbi:hypothetical protein DN31_3842 [Vibrio mimicus]|uniref:Uncharacterized protein n=1 Tax=Vibrio mimicus TaxID=674 RepID=A0A2J9VJ25_VIBMI|nr:hypothetical protein DN31_3842 [Vibrio mimicus]PNM63787.1 hypothetical protein AL544_002120 [Vibrio mimicus]
MEYATKNDINQLRRLLTFSSVLENITVDEITLSDCQFLHDLLKTWWKSVPSPQKLYSYAIEYEVMPISLFKKLIEIRLCKAD